MAKSGGGGGRGGRGGGSGGGGDGSSPSQARIVSPAEFERRADPNNLRGNVSLVDVPRGSGIGTTEVSISRAQARRGGVPGGRFFSNDGTRLIYRIPNTQAAINAARAAGATIPRNSRTQAFIQRGAA